MRLMTSIGSQMAIPYITMVALVTCTGGMAFTFNVTWNYVGDRERWLRA